LSLIRFLTQTSEEERPFQQLRYGQYYSESPRQASHDTCIFLTLGSRSWSSTFEDEPRRSLRVIQRFGQAVSTA